MHIRAYLPSDQQAVVSMWEAAGLTTPQNDPLKDIQRKLQVDADLFLVGVIDGRIIATVMGGYEGHRGWINYLAVQPSTLRAGYGRQMMQAIEKLLLDKGCPKINLQVRSTNSDVIKFYQTLGYTHDRVVSMGKRINPDCQSD